MGWLKEARDGLNCKEQAGNIVLSFCGQKLRNSFMKRQRKTCKTPSMSGFTNSISWYKKIPPPCFTWHELSDLWKLEENILYNSWWHARGEWDKIKLYKAKNLAVLI